mmetsp:Transcript_40286/g.86484  ORF Transcript_40286/g.86484 Transcript_40286/m.86484 type:complete len:283 (-) Transcript_40286:97-945(-)
MHHNDSDMSAEQDGRPHRVPVLGESARLALFFGWSTLQLLRSRVTRKRPRLRLAHEGRKDRSSRPSRRPRLGRAARQKGRARRDWPSRSDWTSWTAQHDQGSPGPPWCRWTKGNQGPERHPRYGCHRAEYDELLLVSVGLVGRLLAQLRNWPPEARKKHHDLSARRRHDVFRRAVGGASLQHLELHEACPVRLRQVRRTCRRVVLVPLGHACVQKYLYRCALRLRRYRRRHRCLHHSQDPAAALQRQRRDRGGRRRERRICPGRRESWDFRAASWSGPERGY